jgi:hypothetical protein
VQGEQQRGPAGLLDLAAAKASAAVEQGRKSVLSAGEDARRVIEKVL